MKKALLLIAVALLAACANNNGTDTAKDNTAAPQTEAIEKPHEVDWEKPQYSIDDHGDTIARWIYDERGRLSKFLTDYDDEGVPGCITEYKYDGNKAHVVFSCEPGYEEDITYADESCTKILENSGQIYEYDEEGRISKITFGNNEITYDYYFTEDGYIHADIIGNLFQQMEERDELGRLISESYVDGLDIYSTTYTYEGNVCYAHVENTIYEKDAASGIPDLEKSYVDEFVYTIYY